MTETLEVVPLGDPPPPQEHVTVRHLTWTVGTVTVVSFAIWYASLLWLSAHVYNQPIPRGRELLVSLVLSATAFLIFASMPAILVLSGRRWIFWLPIAAPWFSLLIGLLRYLSHSSSLTTEQALVELDTWIPVLALVPAITLLLMTRAPQTRLLRPDSIGWTYLFCSFLVILLAYPVLQSLLLGYDIITPRLLDIGSPLGAAEIILAAAGLFIFGTSVGTRRPWWPWLLAVPALLRVVEMIALWLIIPAKPSPYQLTSGFYFPRPNLRSFVGVLDQLVPPFTAAMWMPVQRIARNWWGRFRPGDDAVLRERWDDGIWAARPAVVVKDRPSEKRFFIPTGVSWWYPADDDGNEMRLPLEDWRLEEGEMNTRHILSVTWPRKPYAVLLAWDPNWSFTGYYVNLQTPLERTETGFDYTDHVLDIEMSPDKSSWNWKDEDDLQQMIDNGLFTQQEADDFRAWGQTAVEHILYETPFDEDWSGWRPDPFWELPELPEDWDEL